MRENSTDRLFNEVEISVKTVKFTVNDAILAAMDNLLKSRVEIAVKSVNVFSGRNTESHMSDPDKRDSSEDAESFQVTSLKLRLK